MKRDRFFVLLCLIVTLSSCGPTRFYAGFTPTEVMHGMALLGPLSEQYYIDKQNYEAYSDSLSLVSESLITSYVEEILPITQRVQLNQIETEEAIAFMDFITSQKQKMRGEYPIPVALDDLLELRGERYGLLICAYGMTRDIKGYAKDVAKGLLVGIATAVLTMGAASMYGIPVNYYSNIYAAILDSETDRIVFYNLHGQGAEINPIQPVPVMRQLDSIFRDFLE